MFLSLSKLVAFIGIFTSVFAASIPHSLQRRQDANSCPGTEIITVYIETQVVEYLVLVDVYFETTTTLVVGESITIIISEAPTSISTLLTATSTNTLTSTTGTTSTITSVIEIASGSSSQNVVTGTASAAAATATAAVPSSFYLGVLQGSIAKRQAETLYVDRQGQVGSTATGAAVFQMSSGQLSIEANTVSTESGSSGGQFLSFDGDLSTTFSADTNTGILHWRNSLFTGGEALFCSNEATVIMSSFNNSLPSGCSAITLYIIGADTVASSGTPTSGINTATALASTIVPPAEAVASASASTNTPDLEITTTPLAKTGPSTGTYTSTIGIETTIITLVETIGNAGSSTIETTIITQVEAVVPTASITPPYRNSSSSSIQPASATSYGNSTKVLVGTGVTSGGVFIESSTPASPSSSSGDVWVTITRGSTLVVQETSTRWRNSSAARTSIVPESSSIAPALSSNASFFTQSTPTLSASNSSATLQPASAAYSSSIVLQPIPTTSIGVVSNSSVLSQQASTSIVVTSSSTPTTSGTNAAASSTASPTSTPFVLAMSAQSDTKRDATLSYIDSDGYLTSNSSEAVLFYVINGRLLANGYWVSTNSGLDSNPLLNSTGTISSTFTLNDQGLEWQNSAFSGGAASFCVNSNNRVYAVFTSAAIDDCNAQDLVVVPTVATSTPTIPGTTSITQTSASASGSTTAFSATSPISTSAAASTFTRLTTSSQATSTSGSLPEKPGVFLADSASKSANSVSSITSSEISSTPSSSASASCATPPTEFLILVTEAGVTHTQYLYDNDHLSDDTLTITKNSSLAQTFSFTDSNQLQMVVADQSGEYVTLVSEQDSSSPGAEPVFFSPASSVSPSGSYLPVIASLAADCTTLSLTLPYNGANVLQDCGGVLHLLASAGINGDCTTVSLSVEPVLH